MSSDTSKHRRFCFSLSTLMRWFAVFVLAITLGKLGVEHFRLRAEVQGLRADAGVLDLQDESLVHAIAARTYQQHIFRWKIWCPEGKQVRVHVKTRDIPGTGIPTDRSIRSVLLNSRNLEGTEIEMTLSPEALANGQVRWNIYSDGLTRYAGVDPESARWLVEGASGWSGGPRHVTLRAVEGEPLVLLRLRVKYREHKNPLPEPPSDADGVMVWVTAENHLQP